MQVVQSYILNCPSSHLPPAPGVIIPIAPKLDSPNLQATDGSQHKDPTGTFVRGKNALPSRQVTRDTNCPFGGYTFHF